MLLPPRCQAPGRTTLMVSGTASVMVSRVGVTLMVSGTDYLLHRSLYLLPGGGYLPLHKEGSAASPAV